MKKIMTIVLLTITSFNTYAHAFDCSECTPTKYYYADGTSRIDYILSYNKFSCTGYLCSEGVKPVRFESRYTDKGDCENGREIICKSDDNALP